MTKKNQKRPKKPKEMPPALPRLFTIVQRIIAVGDNVQKVGTGHPAAVWQTIDPREKLVMTASEARGDSPPESELTGMILPLVVHKELKIAMTEIRLAADTPEAALARATAQRIPQRKGGSGNGDSR